MTQFRLDQSADRPATGQPAPARVLSGKPQRHEPNATRRQVRRRRGRRRGRGAALTDALISHSSANWNVALRIEEALEADGLSIWLDDSEIRLGILLGEELQGSIRAAPCPGAALVRGGRGVALGRHGMADGLSRARFIVPCCSIRLPCHSASRAAPAQVQAGHARRHRGPCPRHPRIAEGFQPADAGVEHQAPSWRRRATASAGHRRRSSRWSASETSSTAARDQAALDPVVAAAVKSWPLDLMLVNLAGYHLRTPT